MQIEIQVLRGKEILAENGGDVPATTIAEAIAAIIPDLEELDADAIKGWTAVRIEVLAV